MLLEATSIGLAATMTLTNPIPYDIQMTDSTFNVLQYNHEINLNLDKDVNFSNTLAPYEEYLFEKKTLEFMESDEEFVIKRFVKKTISASFEVIGVNRKSNTLHFD